MKKVLFVSPYMGRTGSEQAVLQVINNCKEIFPALYSGDKGSLLSEVKKNIPVYINPLKDITKNRIQRINKRLGLKTPLDIFLTKIINDLRPDLILLNTFGNHEVLDFIKKTKLPFAVWSHELQSSFDGIFSSDLDYIFQKSRFIIGCSEPVCKLISDAGYKKNVHLFHETIDIEKIINFSSDNTAYVDIRKPYDQVFIMSGKIGYRKGIHFIPGIAEKLKESNSALLWLGSSNEYGLEKLIVEQLKHLKLTNVIFAGEQTSDYFKWFNLGDYFILTSLEDAYPLVMIEAAYLQKPIISFDSGGVKEFVKNGMGRIVPLINTEELYNAIDGIISGEIKTDKALLKKEAERHDIKTQISTFENIIIGEL